MKKRRQGAKQHGNDTTRYGTPQYWTSMAQQTIANYRAGKTPPSLIESVLIGSRSNPINAKTTTQLQDLLAHSRKFWKR